MIETSTGANNGSAKIVSTTSTPLIGAECVIYKVNNIATSFSEMIALPNTQLDTQLRFGIPLARIAFQVRWMAVPI